MVYKTPTSLKPEDVTPDKLHFTRSNGLLIVIKGNHCGKFVQRFHHWFEGNGTIHILKLAMVRRVTNNTESLTGEILELDASHLCVCNELKEDRKLGDSLVDELCRVG